MYQLRFIHKQLPYLQFVHPLQDMQHGLLSADQRLMHSLRPLQLCLLLLGHSLQHVCRRLLLGLNLRQLQLLSHRLLSLRIIQQVPHMFLRVHANHDLRMHIVPHKLLGLQRRDHMYNVCVGVLSEGFLGLR